jgi:hypothetical protein
MARFTHPAISSYGSSAAGTWTVEGGSLGTQPTFSGAPLFSGDWALLDTLCHFAIDVDMDNITNFGSGQYYVVLPFKAKTNYIVSDGCLHDISTGDQYAILGHVLAGSDQLKLFSVASNGKQVAFTSSVPVNLNLADNFHIGGTYQIDPTA